jgi:endonuclease/exonuclease/phosphatase family metal-dependent hydrolase
VHVSQIAAEIEAVQPDLVSLNEVDSHTLRTRVDEPAYLAEATGLHVVYGPNLSYDGGLFGNAILTRYPVAESHNLRLPGTFGLEPRGLLTAIVIVDGRRLAFSSTHLTDGSDGQQSRLLQALAVARALHSMAAPTILAGDLNSDATDVPGRILRGHLLDAQEEGGTGLGDTFPEANPSSRFDYIFYDDHLAVVPGSTRVQTSDSSDHRSVFTKLTLLPKHRCRPMLIAQTSAQIVAELLWSNSTSSADLPRSRWPDTKTTKGRRRQTVPIIEPLRPTLDRVTVWRPG